MTWHWISAYTRQASEAYVPVWPGHQHDIEHTEFMFFFQAEDGIQVGRVTGVQTCALPISTRQQLPDAAPIHQRDRQDRAGLDTHVEQIGTRTQPVLGNQQMPGRGDRQELGDALDDAEDDHTEEVVHGRCASGEKLRKCTRAGSAAATPSSPNPAPKSAKAVLIYP